jgi:hypothetical protein
MSQYTKVRQLWEYLPTVTLDRYSPRFSEGEILHKGGISGDPRGIETEGGEIMKGTP